MGNESMSEWLNDFHGYIETKTAWGVDDSETQSKNKTGDLLNVETLW